MTSVFLSYARADDEAFVKVIHACLTKKGLKVWYDRVDLPSRGEAFPAEIARAVESSERMLLFIGVNSAKSEWCQREWTHALKNCIPVIPILVQHRFSTLPNEIEEAFPSEILEVNGLEFPPDSRDDDTWNKVYNLLTNAPVLPLADLRNVPTLMTYMNRPQYIDEIKRKMRLSDPTDIIDARSAVVAITAKEKATGLYGTAGIGKTTLANALVHECDVRRTFDLIIWLSIGPSKRRNDSLSLLRTLGDGLNAAEAQFADHYRDEDSARLRIENLLGNKRVLLVLDDVWDKGILETFRFNKHLRLIVTTRGSHVLSENMVEIDRLGQDEGVRLITHYINPAAPDTVTIDPAYSEIVKELDGHALALKIIATLLHIQGAHEASAYLQRLRGLRTENLFTLLKEDTLPDRDETRRNLSVEISFSLSYEKLAPGQQKYFRALGIFTPDPTSSADIGALQAVWQISDHVAAKKQATALENVGLLDRDSEKDRYFLHPLLRAYAYALLKEAGEMEEAFGRYVDYVTAQAEPFLTLPLDEWHPLDPLLPHIDYVGDELTRRWREPSNRDDALIRRAGDFAWNVSGYVNYRRQMIETEEGRVLRGLDWLEMGLEAYREQEDLSQQAIMLNNIGGAWRDLGEKDKALGYYEMAHKLFSDVGDKHGEAIALNNIGSIMRSLGEKDKALGCYEEALKLFREVGDKRGEAGTLNNIGGVWHDLGEKDKALGCYKEALKLFREVGDKRGEAKAINNIASFYVQEGGAADMLRQIILVAQSIKNVPEEALYTANLAYVLKMMGQRQEAIAEMEKAIDILRRNQLSYGGGGISIVLYETTLAQWQREEAMQAHAQGRARRRPRDAGGQSPG